MAAPLGLKIMRKPGENEQLINLKETPFVNNIRIMNYDYRFKQFHSF